MGSGCGNPKTEEQKIVGLSPSPNPFDKLRTGSPIKGEAVSWLKREGRGEGKGEIRSGEKQGRGYGRIVAAA
jgi:hypothetical protein